MGACGHGLGKMLGSCSESAVKGVGQKLKCVSSFCVKVCFVGFFFLL